MIDIGTKEFLNVFKLLLLSYVRSLIAFLVLDYGRNLVKYVI